MRQFVIEIHLLMYIEKRWLQFQLLLSSIFRCA